MDVVGRLVAWLRVVVVVDVIVALLVVDWMIVGWVDVVVAG